MVYLSTYANPKYSTSDLPASGFTAAKDLWLQRPAPQPVLTAALGAKNFLPNLPLEMHNFNIFVDTLYLNTDYNVRVCSFLAPSTKFFIWDLAPLTGLKFRFKLIENYTYDIEQILF